MTCEREAGLAGRYLRMWFSSCIRARAGCHTRMKCGIYYLLRLPYLWRHVLDFAFLVGRDRSFGVFET